MGELSPMGQPEPNDDFMTSQERARFNAQFDFDTDYGGSSAVTGETSTPVPDEPSDEEREFWRKVCAKYPEAKDNCVEAQRLALEGEDFNSATDHMTYGQRADHEMYLRQLMNPWWLRKPGEATGRDGQKPPAH